MTRYQKIMLALDFHSDNQAVIDKGQQLAQDHNATLLLVHVMEPISNAYAVDGLDFSDQVIAMMDNVRRNYQAKLDDIGTQLKLAQEQRLLIEGNAADEITSAAMDHQADLIVMGSHSRSGLRLLLGSTANSVLHHAPCDVLMVRLKN